MFRKNIFKVKSSTFKGNTFFSCFEKMFSSSLHPQRRTGRYYCGKKPGSANVCGRGHPTTQTVLGKRRESSQWKPRGVHHSAIRGAGYWQRSGITNRPGFTGLSLIVSSILLSAKFIHVSVGQHDCCFKNNKPSICQPEDAGSYTCVATNSVGEDSWTLMLSVHTHPHFTELLADVSLNKGERLVLACGVSGIPPPTIKWTMNNRIIPGMTVKEIWIFWLVLYCIFLMCFLSVFLSAVVQYTNMKGHSELVIERVSKKDAGTYTCVAENRVGTIKSLGFVHVKGKSLLKQSPRDCSEFLKWGSVKRF